MKETNKTGTRFISCVLAVMMVVTTLTGIFPATVSASSQSGVGSEMWSNYYLDALEYTGYDVQGLRDSGYLFEQGYYASSGYNKGYKSDISGNYNNYLGTSVATGLQTVANSSTKTGYAPDLDYFEEHGFQCGSYVTYVLYNYLKNIVGFDVEEEWGWTKPAGYVSPTYYKTAALEWYAAGNAEILTLGDDYTMTRVNSSDATKGYNFVLNTGVEVPIGSLLLFETVDENGNTSGTIAHIAIYAGEYNGYHFITHTGSNRGPEINNIEYMSMADSADGKSGMAELVTMIVIPPTSPNEEYGKIVVNKTDENGSALAGAVFTATNTSTGDTYTIGPTDSSGSAYNDQIPYGTYTVTETTMPSGYTVKDSGDPWTVTVSSSTPTVTINASNTGTKSFTIRKLDESGNGLAGAVFKLTSTSYSGYSETVTTQTASGGAIASFLSVPYGTYKLTESYVPDGYEASSEDPWTITVSSTGVTINRFSKCDQLLIFRRYKFSL
ncbi:MAG: prealbumin-like fold domain-containing protein [Firmicutes bacterium]|nr:prealbumin-like fold domain-containing protein [Bacillota bacterium]